MVGYVNGLLEAILTCAIRGPDGNETRIDAVIDTDSPTIWPCHGEVLQRLGVQSDSRTEAALADGTVHEFDLYALEIEWNGRWRQITAYCLENSPLIGMSLMLGFVLNVETKPGGIVGIQPIP